MTKVDQPILPLEKLTRLLGLVTWMLGFNPRLSGTKCA
jgi:hypothetical protein